MVGASSNIYVSVTGPQAEGKHDGYRRQQHIWLISVEPHHSAIPGLSHKDREPLHYAASKDPETGVYTLKSFEIADGPGIIGNILIVESAHVSSDKLREALEEDLGPTSPISKSKDREPSDDEPEHWIRNAIHGLQQRKLAESFQIEEFMMFAHGYLANRLENETPAMIAYPKIHKDHEKKSSKRKFWISHPTAERRTRVNSNGDALVYGGLM